MTDAAFVPRPSFSHSHGTPQDTHGFAPLSSASAVCSVLSPNMHHVSAAPGGYFNANISPLLHPPCPNASMANHHEEEEFLFGSDHTSSTLDVCDQVARLSPKLQKPPSWGTNFSVWDPQTTFPDPSTLEEMGKMMRMVDQLGSSKCKIMPSLSSLACAHNRSTPMERCINYATLSSSHLMSHVLTPDSMKEAGFHVDELQVDYTINVNAPKTPSSPCINPLNPTRALYPFSDVMDSMASSSTAGGASVMDLMPARWFHMFGPAGQESACAHALQPSPPTTIKDPVSTDSDAGEFWEEISPEDSDSYSLFYSDNN